MNDMLQATVVVTFGIVLELTAMTSPVTGATIVCPENIRKSNVHNDNYAVVEWNDPITYPEEESVWLDVSHQPGIFHLGITTVTYTVHSSADNGVIAECEFDVTVVDTEKPTIVCPANLNYLIEPGEKQTVTWNEPPHSDNSGFAMMSSSHRSGEVFPVGNTEVSYRVRDPFGNTNTCSFNISVEEIAITCPHDIRVPVDEVVGNATVTWDLPSTPGRGGLASVTSSHSPGDHFVLGITEVTYAIHDTTDNQLHGNCSFRVEIAPIRIFCPDNISVPNDLHVNYAIASWNEPTTQGDEDLVWTNSSHRPGMEFQLGRTTVTYFVYGINGRSVTNCDFDISVTDAEKPEVFCPDDIRVLVGPGVLPGVTWNEPVSSDNSGFVTMSSTHKSGASFPVGNTIVSYTAIDSYGNSERCSFYVNVTAITLICPADVNISTDIGHDYADIILDSPLIDGGQDYVTLTSSHDSRQRFPIGTTIVTNEARGYDDDVVTTCSFNVTVSDTEKPTISCPPEILVFTDASVQPTVRWEVPNVTDNSRHVYLNCSHDPGDVFPIGASQIYCTSWDQYDNWNECDFGVFVEGVDIECPEDIRTSIDKYSTTANVTWDQPEVFGGLDQIYVNVNRQPGKEFSVGHSLIEYIVYSPDAQPLTSCNFSITVYDPDIPTVICPDDLYELTESDKPKEVFWEMPKVFDFSGTANITKHSHKPGTLFKEGTTLITYEASDFLGKTGRCSFSITVEGVTLLCPDNMNTTTDLGSAFANVTLSAVKVISATGLVEVNMTEEIWQLFPIGYSSTVFAAYDTYGKVLTNCTSEVYVKDNESPIITCPDDVLVFVDPLASTSVSWTPPHFWDNSGSVEKIISSSTSGDIFSVGATNVSYTVLDESGNYNGCNFLVVVEEVKLECPKDVFATTDSGMSFASNITWLQPTVHGGSGKFVFISNRQPEDSFEIGNHLITYMTSNESSVSVNCNFTVFVLDIEPPLIQCPDDISILLYSGNTSTQVSWHPARASDNSRQTVKLTSTHQSGEMFDIGLSAVTYIAVDSSGNTASCDFNVIISALCSEDISIVSPLEGILWPATSVESIVDSSKKCPIDTLNSHKPIATRRCLPDDRLGAAWEDHTLTDCGDKNPLTLISLKEIPVRTENVVEVAEALADITRNMESITSQDTIEIVQVMQNVVTVKSDSLQVLLALIDVASSILSRQLSFPCHEEDVLSANALRMVFKLVEDQIALISNASHLLNIHKNDVYVSSYFETILVRNSTGSYMEFGIETHNSSAVDVLVHVSEVCATSFHNTTKGVQATLSVYDSVHEDHQLITRSLKEQTSAIVSPLVAVWVAESECVDLDEAITIQVPLKHKKHEDQYLVNNTTRCVSLDLSEDNPISDWSDEHCDTVNVTHSQVTCICRKMALHAVMVDYQCSYGYQRETGASLLFYVRITCLVAVIVLIISLVLVLAKRNWQLPTHQQILFFRYLSLLCLFSVFLLIGNAGILPFGCLIVRIFLHYFTLTTLLWSAVEAQCMYISSVKMNGIENRNVIPISCTIAWFLPFVLVGITVWLRIDKPGSNACILTDHVVGYFTLILPAGMMVLHNITVYMLTAVQLLRTSRLYPLYKCVCFRLGEAVCVFAVTFSTIVFGYCCIAKPTQTYQPVFAVLCIVNGLLILGVSLVRIIRLPGRSFTYEINNKHGALVKSDSIEMIGKIYFSPIDETLKMASIKRAQQIATKENNSCTDNASFGECNSKVNESADICLMRSVL